VLQQTYRFPEKAVSALQWPYGKQKRQRHCQKGSQSKLKESRQRRQRQFLRKEEQRE